ncbi:MAG: GatB/YqeY domain-containing protein [Rubricoccaceae bacterium]
MLKDQLTQDLKDAMRAKDLVRRDTIRMVQAAIIEKEKSGSGEATEDDVLAILTKQAKQRRDAIQQYTAADRLDLSEKEANELAVIESYLPQQLSDEEVQSAVQAIVERTGATSMKDMGRVMGAAMGELKGKADGSRVQAAVRATLSA